LSYFTLWISFFQTIIKRSMASVKIKKGGAGNSWLPLLKLRVTLFTHLERSLLSDP
jgi:hypothetical protein